MQSNSKKFSRMCNERTSSANSGDINNLGDTCKNGISCNSNNKHLHKDILKIKNTSQIELIETNNSFTDFKYTSNCQQKIKPCFVELDACFVENYILDCKKIMGAMQGIHSDVKFPCTDTSHTEKDIFKGHNVISQSISIEDNTIKNLKDMSIKECFVALYDNIKNQKLKTEESINSVDMKDKSNIPHSTLHNSSASCNAIVLPYDMKRNRRELIKDSIVKMEKLKIDRFVKQDSIACKEKEEYIISSTPLRKCVKSFTSSVLISPININTRNTLHPKQKCSISNVEEDISNIVPSDQRNSPSLIMPSKCNFDAMDIYEKSMQILSSCQETLADPIMEIKVTSSSEEEDDIHTALTQKDDIHTALMQKDDIHTVLTQKDNIHTALTQKNNIHTALTQEDDIYTALTQKCNIECKVVLKPLLSFNVFSVADSDKSLFSDTMHDYSSKNIEECKVQKVHLTNKSTDVNIADSSADLGLKRMSNNANTSTSPSGKTPMMEDFEDNITDKISKIRTQPEYGSATQENISTSIHENSKNETVNNDKDSFLYEDQNNINNSALLARLQDSIRITERRMRYVKWSLSIQSNIWEKSTEEAAESNSKIFHCEAMDETCNTKSEMNNFEHSKNAVKKSLDHVELLDYSTQLCDDTNKQVEKPVFLKPGKHWARSLSILNRINDGSDLRKLSCGKGKRWRHSVRDILDMQKQGNLTPRDNLR